MNSKILETKKSQFKNVCLVAFKCSKLSSKLYKLTYQQKYVLVFFFFLRVGKTVFTTKHYYERSEPPNCGLCNELLTVPHILTECPHSKIDLPLEDILDCTTKLHIPKILNCLQQHGIQEV